MKSGMLLQDGCGPCDDPSLQELVIKTLCITNYQISGIIDNVFGIKTLDESALYHDSIFTFPTHSHSPSHLALEQWLLISPAMSAWIEFSGLA